MQLREGCEPGKAMMGTAVAGGPDRANKAADAAVACPLLEGIDLSGARGVLGADRGQQQHFKLAESRSAMNTIRRYAADDAHVSWAAKSKSTRLPLRRPRSPSSRHGSSGRG